MLHLDVHQKVFTWDVLPVFRPKSSKATHQHLFRARPSALVASLAVARVTLELLSSCRLLSWALLELSRVPH